jgi:hypothetical protein
VLPPRGARRRLTTTASAALRPEDRILLCAARPRLSPERAVRLERLLAAPIEWNDLLAHADRHGLIPLLHRHVAGRPAAVLPAAVRAALAQGARDCLVRNLCLHGELLHLLGALNRAGVPVIPLKGSFLAHELYGDLALRPMSDVDLLVRPEDVTRSDAVLRAAGCIRAAEQGADYHTSYVTRGGDDAGVVVEIHHHLAESHTARLDIRAVWAAASRIRWEGREIWTMALPDLFLSLCLHAAKDGLASVRSLLDIVLVAERFHDTLPWAALVRTVQAARIRIPVHTTLVEARGLLEAPVPPEFLRAIRPAWGLGWPLSRALLRWRGGVLHVPPALLVGPVMAILMLLWEDSLRGRLRHVRRNLFPTASLRARWIPRSAPSSGIAGYLHWVRQAVRELSGQVTARSRSGGERRRRDPS